MDVTKSVGFAPRFFVAAVRHCEERSDEAIHNWPPQKE
jgi:hypothetical protein